MNAQWWLVMPVVLVAALYTCWRLAPGTLRLRVRRALGLRPPPAGAGSCANCREPKH